MKPMTVYRANCFGKDTNTSYPVRCEITRAEDLRVAAVFDHVCAEYRRNHRSNRDFVRADCLPLDLDNSHSDTPEDWKALEDIQTAFPDVPFYAVPSRNHMKPKEGKLPRPRYHVYFPIDPVTSYPAYRKLKERAIERFPWFDVGAKDAARFLYGVDKPEVITIDGGTLLTALLGPSEPFAEPDAPDAGGDPGRAMIPLGARNSTLSHLAGRLLKRFGADDGRAREQFDARALACEVPLEEAELETIWESALKFYRTTVSTSPDYIPPDQYAVPDFAPDMVPDYFTDVGEAQCLVSQYGGRLRYSEATGWIQYDQTRWTENSAKARGLVHALTRQQLRKARDMAMKATDAFMKAQEQHDEAAEGKAEAEKAIAEQFHSFARKMQTSSRVTATLTEAAPYVQIDVKDLDGNPFLLNTPAGTVDLRTGDMLPHFPEDYCTKLTGCSPSADGAELFGAFLDRVTCGDAQLRDYLQLVAGMIAVGAVYRECLIIAYGSGGNGKSTLFNLLSYVMGDYAGSMSAETLTVNYRRNTGPEFAELRGKRLVIAAELEEGLRFDTAVIKKLCSTDPIHAEAKYKAPFSFVPSHTLVLFTNHLPRVGTSDRGTWDRLVVIPFNAKLRGNDDEVMNYGLYLFDHAGGAALQWMIHGARRFIEADFRIQPPDCVRAAVDAYRAENDWLRLFLDECCEIGPKYRQPGGALYQKYREYCAQTGEYTRHSVDFSHALQDAGFELRRTKKGIQYFGLRVRPEIYGYTAPAAGDD